MTEEQELKALYRCTKWMLEVEIADDKMALEEKKKQTEELEKKLNS